MILKIKQKIQQWKDNRILKKSGCETWEQYHRIYDPDFNIQAPTVKQQFHGYPYVAKVDFEKRLELVDSWTGPVYCTNQIVDWCKQHCCDKYRHHWERVICDHELQYYPNGIGGSDELFFGFKNYQDYTYFLLRWG